MLAIVLMAISIVLVKRVLEAQPALGPACACRGAGGDVAIAVVRGKRTCSKPNTAGVPGWALAASAQFLAMCCGWPATTPWPRWRRF
jgi:hypothetical protein